MKRQRMLELTLIGVVCLSAFIPSTVDAGTVYVRLIGSSYPVAKWYDWLGSSGRLNFSNTTLSGGMVYTYNDVYELTMTGTFTFNPNLGRDYSAGDGLAKGYFEGGATVTFTGGIRDGATYVYGGTGAAAKQIFQATLNTVYEDPLNPGLNRWALEENATEAGRFDRTLFLTFVEGSEGLASGIVLNGTGDILRMTGPKMDLSLKTASTVSNFGADISSGGLASRVEITGLLPEPATILMLGLGGLCLRKRV